MASFLSTYPSVDPGGLTLAVYEKLCSSIGPVKALQDQEYDDNMVRQLELARTNRQEIIGVWFKGLFPQPRFDDG